MNFASLDTLRPLGMLGARCALSAARLEGPEYRPDTIFIADQAAWYGDWEGRTLLAQCLISRATGKHPSFMMENLAALDAHMNELGYLGPILPEGEFSEQQLSGHSWLLRGLCEIYELTGDLHTLEHIRNIMTNLFLPAKEAYSQYPLEGHDHVVGGLESGSVAGRSGAWHISTDTGCAFIPLDGVSHAYCVLRDTAIADLLEVMIERYLKLDFDGLMVQTHATLSGCRGMLRYAMAKGDKTLIGKAERIFSLYLRKGMTAHYANYNWFGRPLWTEPCAIIDSYMVAMQLFSVTGKRIYLDFARKICFNGIFRGQRNNGGFGTDSCPGPENGSGLELAMGTYEASWCCTMRGGEGLARILQYGVMTDGSRALFTHLRGSEGCVEISGGTLQYTLTSQFPTEGKLSLVVHRCPAGTLIEMALPDWVGEVTVNGEKGEIIGGFLQLTPISDCRFDITFKIPLRREPVMGDHNGRGALLCHGDLILGANGPLDSEPAYVGKGCYTSGDTTLSPICDSWLMKEDKLADSRLKVIF